MNKHLATISAVYEAFGKGDISFIINQLADDVQWESWADNSAQKVGVPWVKAIKGKENVAGFFQTLIEKLNIKEFTVLDLMASENQVSAEFVIEAEVFETGANYRDEEIHLWTFNSQGKITRLRHYLDTQKHIQVAFKPAVILN